MKNREPLDYNSPIIFIMMTVIFLLSENAKRSVSTIEIVLCVIIDFLCIIKLMRNLYLDITYMKKKNNIEEKEN